jgi:hypothetical protein
MSLYSQNVSNNPLMLDGLVVGNFDEVYINGVPVNITGYVPYTGATGTIDVNSQNIKSTFVPLVDADLINKLYADTYYNTTQQVNTTGFGSYSIPYVASSTSGAFNPLVGAQVYIEPATGKLLLNQLAFNSTPSTGTITYTLGIDSGNNVVKYTSSAVIPTQLTTTATYTNASFYFVIMNVYNGTSTIYSSPSLTINPATNLVTMSSLSVGNLSFSALPSTGTPTYTLGFDSGGALVKYASSSSVPSQVNVTNTTANATYWFPIIDSNSGVVTLSCYTNMIINPSTGLVTINGISCSNNLNTGSLSFSVIPSTGTIAYYLAIDSGNNVIRTASAGVPTQINPALTTALTTYYPAFFSTHAVGAQNVYIEGNGYLTYVPSSTGGTLGTPTLYTATIYNTGSALVLEGRGASAPINMYSTSALNFYIGTVASSTIYGNISTSGFTTTYVTAPTIKTDNILSNGATNLVITGSNGGNVIIKAGVSNIGTFNVAGLDMGIYPVLTTTINGLAGTISFQTSSTTYATITTGVNSNNINSFSSNPLTLTGTNGTINMVSGATTVATVSTGLGIKCDLFTSNNGNNMNFNAQGAGDAFLYKFAGTSVFSFTNSSGPVLNANSGTIQFSIGGTTYASISTTQLFTPTKTGSTLSYLTFSPSSAKRCAQLTNTNTAFGASILTGGNYDSGNFFVLTDSTTFGGGVGGMGHWGSTTGSGFVSLQPGVAWLPMYFGGSAVQVYWYGGLAVTLGGGGWTNISDERYKNNIKSLKTESSLKRVLALRPCTYRRNFCEKQASVPIEEKEKQHIGFIAQEVKNSNPHCVSEVEDQEVNEKRMGINYNDYIIHLVGAVQEQQKMISALQAETALRTSEVKDLQAQVEFLTIKMNELLEKIK